MAKVYKVNGVSVPEKRFMNCLEACIQEEVNQEAINTKNYLDEQVKTNLDENGVVHVNGDIFNIELEDVIKVGDTVEIIYYILDDYIKIGTIGKVVYIDGDSLVLIDCGPGFNGHDGGGKHPTPTCLWMSAYGIKKVDESVQQVEMVVEILTKMVMDIHEAKAHAQGELEDVLLTKVVNLDEAWFDYKFDKTLYTLLKNSNIYGRDEIVVLINNLMESMTRGQ